MNDFEKAKLKGIGGVNVQGFMSYTEDSGSIVVDYEQTEKRLARDAALQTSVSVGVPSVFTTYIDPQVVPILFGALNASKVMADEKKGDRYDKFMTFTVEEYAGKVTPYSDFTGNVSTDVNYEYPVRENFLFQTVIKYGDLEAGIAAKAKLNLVSSKQRAAAYIIGMAHNKFALYGVGGKKIYGMLNDPNLPTSIAPISINSKSTWADKITSDPEKGANIIFNDINKLWAQIASNNGGHADQNGRIVLAISNTMSSYLSTPNSFGLSAIAMLKKAFPLLEVIQLPELSTAAGEMLFMVVPEAMGTETGNTCYSEKYFMGRVIPQLSHYEQKVFGGTWGTVIKRPSMIATMVGI